MLPITSQTLLTHITETFSSPGWCNFLLPLSHDEAFDFILDAITEELQSCPAEDLTLLMDVQTAQQSPVLKKMGHAAHIYISGNLQSLESNTNIQPIPDLDLPINQNFIILVSPTTSCLLIQAPPKEDSESEDTIYGYLSVHTDAVSRIAHQILEPAPLSTPAQISSQGSFSLSPIAMNLMKQAGDFILQQHRIAIVQKNDMTLILDILKSLSVRRSTHELLYVFVEKIAESIHAARCSVVRIWDNATEAHVLASHEDSSIDDMIIQLDKYPEIQNTLQTASTTVINDLESDPITSPIAHQLTQLGITSILVIPIVMTNPKVGTFLLRIIRKGGAFSQREIDFCRIASETASNAIERSDLFDTIQQTNRTLERLATTDSLTGLHNRRYFMERLDEEIARSMRYGAPLSCILMDIDDFKSVNDTFGHIQGDTVLKEVSRRTLIAIRATDIVARYGGEEFIILLPQTDLEGSKTHAKRLLDIIPEKPYKGLPEDMEITVSMGLACITPDEIITADALIKAADDALYEAKRMGKNKLVIAQ